MNKRKLILLSAIVIAAMIGSTFAIIRASTPAQQPIRDPPSPAPTFFSYTVKWICNVAQLSSAGNMLNLTSAEDIGLVPAEYKTDINVHNPSTPTPTLIIRPLTIAKKFVQSVPESPNVFKNNIAFAFTSLGPDNAFFMTCDEILSVLHIPPGQAAKGFVILTTTIQNLDVVAEYSGETFAPGTGAGTLCVFLPGSPPVSCASTGHSLDIERISVASALCMPGWTVTISPTPPFTFSLSATGGRFNFNIVVTSVCGFTGVVCANPGPQGFVGIPVTLPNGAPNQCQTLPPNGSITIMAFIGVSSAQVGLTITTSVIVICDGMSMTIPITFTVTP